MARSKTKKQKAIIKNKIESAPSYAEISERLKVVVSHFTACKQEYGKILEELHPLCLQVEELDKKVKDLKNQSLNFYIRFFLNQGE